MGRSDAHLLPVPQPQRQQPISASPTDQDVQLATDDETETTPVPPLTHCPHCQAPLCAIDLKTNYCFRCKAMLVQRSSHRLGQGGGAFTVHL